MHYTLLHFPQIKLERRHGHKLRGYFANLFGEESDFFSNHQADGKVIYRYPRIQYKVVHGEPMVLGLAEGAALLIERFLNITALEIEGLHIPVFQKNIKSAEQIVGVVHELLEYQFINPWKPLNDKNYTKYLALNTRKEKEEFLKKILITNIIEFFKVAEHWEENKILVSLKLSPTSVKFKNQNMMAFKGGFTTNVKLPNYIGLGKTVSRGYGTIKLR